MIDWGKLRIKNISSVSTAKLTYRMDGCHTNGRHCSQAM